MSTAFKFSRLTNDERRLLMQIDEGQIFSDIQLTRIENEKGVSVEKLIDWGFLIHYECVVSRVAVSKEFRDFKYKLFSIGD